ncbi:hypothetical protein BS47DRAFT_1388240 [Hydnum rufescens UP504]|uniref:Acetyl-CoA synthetase-like protein n=1 Tax=Hydnum rufescens UP504 TaxID=1448309 RepID=A0A9P6B8E6_9AGAM|nr:hypothetical protein BS47DRAFT_1388240 [Hydnum rufescens UP504]
MPPPIIYGSPPPPVEIKSSSIFTSILLSEKASIDGSSAYIDAASGTRMSRFETHDLSLRLFSPNSRAWPPTLSGLIVAGLRPTLANSSCTPRELTHQMKDSGTGMIFVHLDLFPVVIETFVLLGIPNDQARRRVVIMSCVDKDRADEKAPNLELFVGVQVNETALPCYSSDSIGTTGLSKGVEITHNNVVSFITAYLSYFDKANPKTDVIAGVLHSAYCVKSIPLVLVLLVTLNVNFADVVGEHSAVLAGVTYGILMSDLVANVPEIVLPRFEPNFFAQTIERYRISVAFFGGRPLGNGLVKKVLTKFAERGNTRLKITQSYGLTGTLGTHWLHVEDSIRKIGSIGCLIPNVQARLVDEDDEDIQPGPEKRGELWIRMRSKYYERFKTGDIATMDDEGFFRIVDRKKELIKYKGFQVPPTELEAMLLSRRDILDAAVIGLESTEEATELPCAYVVPARNAELLKDPKAAAAFGKEIEEWIKTKVAHHKFLRGSLFVIDTIAKSDSGKILRRKLKELVAKKETLH